MKFNKDILPKWWSIVVWITILLFTQGCYTQLSMFHPEPEIENDDSEEFYSYSSAGPMKSVGMYAQDRAGQSLGMAYSMMYNRFSGFTGFGNRYNYYNPYGGYYNETYTLGGYTMNIPWVEEKTPRTWSRDGKSPGTNLTVTRTRTNTTESSYNGSSNNSSNVSSDRSSSTSSSSSSSSKSSGGRRATRRN
jgi:hypothetical protein